MELPGGRRPCPSPLPPSIRKRPVILWLWCFAAGLPEKAQNRAVKKTLTLPAWLNKKRKNAHQFFPVLQAALKQQLQMDN